MVLLMASPCRHDGTGAALNLCAATVVRHAVVYGQAELGAELEPFYPNLPIGLGNKQVGRARNVRENPLHPVHQRTLDGRAPCAKAPAVDRVQARHALEQSR